MKHFKLKMVSAFALNQSWADLATHFSRFELDQGRERQQEQDTFNIFSNPWREQ
jgi:hypothetical protein